MTAAAYTIGAMLLTFATLHIIAAAITAHSVAAHAASAETAAPSATFPSLNKADPNHLKAEAAAPEPHAIGFVVGMLFLFVLAFKLSGVWRYQTEVCIHRYKIPDIGIRDIICH